MTRGRSPRPRALGVYFYLCLFASRPLRGDATFFWYTAPVLE
jgi:hypothetical protein